jgi:hypothetical protein
MIPELSPQEWPHQVIMRDIDCMRYEEMLMWGLGNFGQPDLHEAHSRWTWSSLTLEHEHTIVCFRVWFRSLEDAALFSLLWGG